jgi:hypothetical protein
MWNLWPRKKESQPVQEGASNDYLIDFDELSSKVKALSPKAQCALVYKIAGSVHPSVLESAIRYFNDQKKKYVKSSKSRQGLRSGGRYKTGEREGNS